MQTKTFFEKYWGWFALILFAIALIYILFHKSPAQHDFSSDHKTVDSLQTLLIEAGKQRIRDSVEQLNIKEWNDAVFAGMSLREDSLDNANDALRKRNDALKNSIASSGADTSLSICTSYLKMAVQKIDSVQEVADGMKLFQKDRDEYFMSLVDTAMLRARKSDSLFAWSTQAALLISNKYDTLYKSNKKTQSQLATSRTEVKIGAGLLLVAIGWIVSTIIK